MNFPADLYPRMGIPSGSDDLTELAAATAGVVGTLRLGLRTRLPPRCSPTGRMASARKGLHRHSCQGEGATELPYAKQKSLKQLIETSANS